MRQVDTACTGELSGSVEAVVAFDQLELPVALVALELNRSKPADAGSAQEGESDLPDLGVPFEEVVAPPSEPGRVLTDLPPRVMDKRAPMLVEVGRACPKPVVASGNDLRDDDLEAETSGLCLHRFELGTVSNH